MADGLKGAITQTVTDIAEGVVKPPVEEGMKAIEEGITTLVQGPTATKLDPAATQKKQADYEKRKQWALKVIEWNKNLQEGEQKIKAEKLQKIQQERQEEQQAGEVKQFKVVDKQKKELTAAQLASRKSEIKGRGVGG